MNLFWKKRVNKNSIYLFRHGKTDFNTKGIFTGWMDSKLTKEGIRNAKTIALKLKKKRIDVAIHTRLSRSKDTLKYVLEFHPECKIIICDDKMIERRYGDFEGVSHKKFIENVGKQILKLECHGTSFCDFNLRTKKEMEKLLGEKEYEVLHRGWNTPAPNGESFKDVEKRVKKFIKWLKNYVKKNNVNIAISAHGNSIRLFRKIWEKASKEEAVKWFIPYDKVYEYKI
jgi:bisphosphoglycerate-dependent phosphoglycerate mutase family 1